MKKITASKLMVYLIIMGALLFLGKIPLRSQEPEKPTPPAPVSEEKEPTLSFNFKNTSVDTVLQYVSQETGFTIIKEAKVSGKVNAVSAQEIPVSEAVNFLNSVLRPLNVTIIKLDNILKVVTIDEAKRRNIAIKVGIDPDKIEITDQVITQIIPLRYASATDIQKELKPILPRTAELAVNVRSNSIIMTDTSTNIHRFVKILSVLDSQILQITRLKVYPLKNADASEMAKVIEEIFEMEPETAGQPAFGGMMGRMMSMMSGQRGRTEEKSKPYTARRQVKTTADPRTNSVIVTASEEYIKIIDELVKELDADTTEKEKVLVYNLKNASAANLETILNNLFSGTQQSTAQNTGTRNRRQQQQGNIFGRMRAATGMFWGFQGQGRTGATQAPGVLTGEVKVKADEETNSLIIVTSPRNFETVKSIIEQLDRVRPQVLIKVFIAEVILDKTTEFGVEGSWENTWNVKKREDGTHEPSTDFDLGTSAKDIGFKYQVLSESVDILLHALKKQGKLNVLSTPRILALDNQEASINIGRRVPFIRSSRQIEAGGVLNTVGYEDIGIILKVTPHINPDGLVRMVVAPEVSNMAPESESVTISEGVTSPVFESTKAETTVAVKDGQTVIIGGLIKDNKTKTTWKTPILGDIPLLGFFFRSEDSQNQKTELMIFLTPYVINNPQELRELSEIENSQLKLIEDDILREGKRKWSDKRRD